MKAEIARKYLNGLICVYKPSGVTIRKLRDRVIENLCKELNGLEVRPPINHVTFTETAAKDIIVKVQPSYADNILVVGPRYQPQDMKVYFPSQLGIKTSGVLVCGVNEGSKMAHTLQATNPIRIFHVKGCLGQVTDNSFKDGKVLAKAKFHHVTRSILEKVLATFQAAHQKQMFISSGVDIQTQAAYDLAVQGVLRPDKVDGIPVIYSLKCIDFQPPDFTLEVYAINTKEDYLLFLIREIGRKLRTLAMCTGVRCIRYGPFTVDNALLRKHWTVDHIIQNITESESITSNLQTSSVLQHQSPVPSLAP